MGVDQPTRPMRQLSSSSALEAFRPSRLGRTQIYVRIGKNFCSSDGHVGIVFAHEKTHVGIVFAHVQRTAVFQKFYRFIPHRLSPLGEGGPSTMLLLDMIA